MTAVMCLADDRQLRNGGAVSAVPGIPVGPEYSESEP